MNYEPQTKRLYRSTHDRQVSGVSGGLGEYFGVDPTLIRIAWVVTALATGPGALLVYALLAVIVPKAPADTSYF